jgi:hypothetical protein
MSHADGDARNVLVDEGWHVMAHQSAGTLWYSMVASMGLDQGEWATACDTARRLNTTDVGGPCQLPSFGQVGGPHYPHWGGCH